MQVSVMREMMLYSYYSRASKDFLLLYYWYCSNGFRKKQSFIYDWYGKRVKLCVVCTGFPPVHELHVYEALSYLCMRP